MIRVIALIAGCLIALPSAAQTPPDASRAIEALAAIWRPVDAHEITSATAATQACTGAVEEMAALEAAMPPVITGESLSGVRALRGLLIVAGEPGTAFFFPNGDMPWFASGLGAVVVLSEADGLLGVQDAAGHNISLQLGRAGGHPVLRVHPPQGTILTFVGCARTGS